MDVLVGTVQGVASHQLVLSTEPATSADGDTAPVRIGDDATRGERGSARIKATQHSVSSAAVVIATTYPDAPVQSSSIACPSTTPFDLSRLTRTSDDVRVAEYDKHARQRLSTEFDRPKIDARFDCGSRVGTPVYAERRDSTVGGSRVHSALAHGELVGAEGSVDRVDTQPPMSTSTPVFICELHKKRDDGLDVSILKHSTTSTITTPAKTLLSPKPPQPSFTSERSGDAHSEWLARPEEHNSAVSGVGGGGACGVVPGMFFRADMQTEAARGLGFTSAEDYLGNLSAPVDCDVTRRWISDVMSPTASDVCLHRGSPISIGGISDPQQALHQMPDAASEIYGPLALNKEARFVAATGGPCAQQRLGDSPLSTHDVSEPHRYGSLTPRITHLHESFCTTSATTPLTMTSPAYANTLDSAVAFYEIGSSSGVGGGSGRGGGGGMPGGAAKYCTIGSTRSVFDYRSALGPHTWSSVAASTFVEGTGGRPVTSLKAREAGVVSAARSGRFRADENKVIALGSNDGGGSGRSESLLMLGTYLRSRCFLSAEHQGSTLSNNPGRCSTAMSGCGEGSLRVASDASMLRQSLVVTTTISSIESVESFRDVSSVSAHGEDIITPEDRVAEAFPWCNEAEGAPIRDGRHQLTKPGVAVFEHQADALRASVFPSDAEHNSVLASEDFVSVASRAGQSPCHARGCLDSWGREICSAVDVPEPSRHVHPSPSKEPLENWCGDADFKRTCTKANQERRSTSSHIMDPLVIRAAATPLPDFFQSSRPSSSSSVRRRSSLSRLWGFSTSSEAFQGSDTPGDAPCPSANSADVLISTASAVAANTLEDSSSLLPTSEKSASRPSSTPIRATVPIADTPAQRPLPRRRSGRAAGVERVVAASRKHPSPVLPSFDTPEEAHSLFGRPRWSGFITTSVVTTGCFFTDSHCCSSRLPAILQCGGGRVTKLLRSREGSSDTSFSAMQN